VASSIAHPVLLVRHASTTWTGRRWCGRADPILSTDGRRAARRLGPAVSAALGDRSARVAMLISPARRARQTAASIETALDVAATVEPDLLEVDVGVAEGLDWPTLELRHPDLADEIARGIQPDWPGGETRADVERRAARAAHRIRTAAARRPVVVVSHGGIIHAVATLLVEDGGPVAALQPAEILRLDPATPRGRRPPRRPER
jgi:probable phosphoglycerate mutase